MSALELPTCPRCGEPAHLLIGDTQAFCGNESCNVLMWNPLDPESWTREHVVRLVDAPPTNQPMP